MNMMSVLLGATGILLIAAFALSFGSLNKGVADGTTKEEIAALKAEILALEAQERQLIALRYDNATVSAAAPVVENTLTAAEEDALLAAENDALKSQIEDLESQVAESEKKADVYRDEAGLVGQKAIGQHNSDQRRARVVREAMLIATVTEWSAEQGFAVLSIQKPDSAQQGTILGIRRNSGILGTVKISQIYEGGQAIADPEIFPNGVTDIQPGDELIIPPL